MGYTADIKLPNTVLRITKVVSREDVPEGSSKTMPIMLMSAAATQQAKAMFLTRPWTLENKKQSPEMTATAQLMMMNTPPVKATGSRATPG